MSEEVVLVRKITFPPEHLRKRMQDFGMVVFKPDRMRNDTREMMFVGVPKGWSIGFDSHLSVIIDPEGMPRFVDLNGGEDRSARLFEVHLPSDLLEKVNSARETFVKAKKVQGEPLTGFPLISWMFEAKPATLRRLLHEDEDLHTAEVAQTYVQPPLPSLTDFRVTQTEVRSTQFRRPERV